MSSSCQRGFDLDKMQTVKNNGTLKAAIFKICCISPAPAILALSGACAERARGSDWSQNNASKASKASHASEASITHLELRSPMFGETCISKSM